MPARADWHSCCVFTYQLPPFLCSSELEPNHKQGALSHTTTADYGVYFPVKSVSELCGEKLSRDRYLHVNMLKQ